MKFVIISTVIFAACFCAIPAQATLVDISAATNKPVYDLGEEVVVFVIAYNPNPKPVTLTGGFYFASYIIDGTFDWFENQGAVPFVYLELTIEPYGFRTKEIRHGVNEMKIYPLGIGTHTVVGQVLANELIGDGKSAPVEFEVIPEPTTICILALGALMLIKKDKKST